MKFIILLKYRILFFIIPIVIFIHKDHAKASLNQESVTLEIAFQAALRKNEDLALQNETLIQNEEKQIQAKSAFYPIIVGSASYLSQEVPAGKEATTIYPPHQSIAQLTLIQPLFRGLRDFAALKQATQLSEAGKLNQEQLKIQLYQSLVQIFYKILLFEKEWANLKSEIALHEKRRSELKGLASLGRSRNTEILSIQSNIATLEAQIEATRGLIGSTRTSLTLLTGLPSQGRLVEHGPIPKQIYPLNKYLEKIESRSDILSLVQSQEAAESGIRLAQGGHYPSANLIGDYYFQRPGLLQNVHWDIQIGLSIPIFQGGLIQSQVRQASSQYKQTEINLQKARRSAKQQIESLFMLFQSHYAQLEKQKIAVELTRKNYYSQLHDYKLGLVTNLEVLQSLTLFQQSQRLSDQISFQLQADYLCLLASSLIEIETMPQQVKGSL